MSDWDHYLWWLMLSTGLAAAALSITAAYHDRRASDRPSRRVRYILHVISYILMSISILAFASRGLIDRS
jgi:hypothetical protein